jgi:hypothetical protein
VSILSLASAARASSSAATALELGMMRSRGRWASIKEPRHASPGQTFIRGGEQKGARTYLVGPQFYRSFQAFFPETPER